MQHLLGEEYSGRQAKHLAEDAVAVGGADPQLRSDVINPKMLVSLHIQFELLIDQSLEPAADLVGKLHLLIGSRGMQIRLNRECFPQLAEQIEDRRLQHHPLRHCNIAMDCG
ncbi:hypothetical protein D3C79_929410 [compost metagenome]